MSALINEGGYFCFEMERFCHIICLYLLVTLAVFTACQSHENSTPKTQSQLLAFNQARPLTGKVVKLTPALVKPLRISLVADSLLCVVDPNNKLGQILIYNKYTYELVKATGGFGQGPGEFVGIAKIVPWKRHLWVFDVTNKTLTRLDLDSLLRYSDYTLQVRIKFYRRTLANFEVISDTTFLGVVFGEEPVFRIFDWQLNEINAFGHYPELDRPRDIEPWEFKYKIRGNLFTGKLATYRDSLFMFVFDSYSLAYLGNFRQGQIKQLLVGPDDPLPLKYNIIDDNYGVTQPDAKQGYGTVITTPNYIYALYSGVPLKKSIEYGQLFVFDWNGNPVAKFNLHPTLFSFTVDEPAGKIYGIGWDEDIFVVFDFDPKALSYLNEAPSN